MITAHDRDRPSAHDESKWRRRLDTTREVAGPQQQGHLGIIE